MRVVLLDNIRGIGRVGDIKDVSDGYARNFLLPRGKAKAATGGALKEADSLKAERLAAEGLARSEAEVLQKRLDGTTVELAAKASAKGKLFAAIEPARIAQAVSDAAGARIASGQIGVSEHLKTLGDHAVTVHLTDGVSAAVTVRITQQAP